MALTSDIGATYLPMEFRQALSNRITLPEVATGAALFSDFSGFTVLAQALTSHYGANRGAEHLAELMRNAFDGIISAIHNYSGSIIGFSGDAVTVWFDDDSGAELRGAVRAVAAARAIHDFVAQIPAHRIDDTRRLSIGVKVSVSAGPVRRYVVGDRGIQRMAVFAGETMQRLAMADAIAAAGDLIVDGRTFEYCKPLLQPTKRGSPEAIGDFVSVKDARLDTKPCPWPPLPSLSFDLIGEWLLADVETRLRHGSTEFLGAFKPIVAVFLNFGGIDYDHDPDAGRQLSTLVSRIQQIAADYGGHLVDVTVGDKGSYVFVAFGALQTHENDASRAMAAVVALRRAGAGIKQLREAAIGVARGSVYVGDYGGHQRRTYGVVGQDIIVAARLMSLAAPEQTLVTPHIADLAAPQFGFVSHATVELKGMVGPIPVFRLSAQSDSIATSPISALSTDRLVGRKDECAIIDDLVSSLGDDPPGLLVVEGEPGIGKTRMLEYLLQQADRSGVPILVGASDAIGSTSRYHAWRAVFRQLMSIPASGSTECAATALAFLEANLPDLVHLAPLLNDAVGVYFEDNDLTRNMRGQPREDNTTDLLIRILANYTQQEPAIVVLEDGHWFDAASGSLLLKASNELANASIVVTRRPASEEYAANTVYSLDEGRACIMPLGPLASAAIEQLIADVLQTAVVPPELHEFVVQKAQGSPFFSRELTIALLDAGLIAVADSHCTLVHGVSGLEQADFPFTIQGAIGSRIDHLPQTQQLVLKIGSVIGREFDYEIVRDLMPSGDDRQSLHASLTELDKTDLIELTGSVAAQRYVFRHVLTQEVAYGMLLHRQRVVLHENAARWYEQAGKSDESQVLLLAHHWSRAALERPGDAESGGKAVKYLALAAEQGIVSNSNREAVRFINEALVIDDRLAADAQTPPRRRARWFAALAHAHHALGDEAPCRAAVERGLICANAPLPRTNMHLALSSLAQILRQAGTRVLRTDVNKVAIPATKSETLLAQCALYRNLSRALWGSNESMLMLYANLRNLNLSERLGPSGELAVIYSHMVMTLGVFQLPKWAGWYGRRSLALARQVGDLSALATVLIGLAVNAVSTAEWDEARATLEECLELCSRLGDTKQWAEAAALKGDVALLTGDVDKGLACYLDVYGRAERKGSLGHVGLSLRTQAMAAIQQHNLAAAKELLVRAEHVLADTAEKLIQIDIFGLLALVNFRAGAMTQAYEQVQRAVKLIGETMPPIAYPRVFGMRSASHVILDLLESSPSDADAPFDTRDLRALAKRMQGHLNAYQRIFRIGAPVARIHRARMLWLRGRRASARIEINRAIETAERLQLQPVLDEARSLAAKMAPGTVT